MKRWLSSVIAIAAGVCIGIGTGYVGALIKAGKRTVLLASPAGHKFDLVYASMGNLNALEKLASNCKGVSDVRSTLAEEGDLIQNLRQNNDSNVSPPIMNVAEATLAIRTALSAETEKNAKLKSEQEARAEALLQSAGWRNASASHMRQITAALDQEQCRQSSTRNGDRNQ